MTAYSPPPFSQKGAAANQRKVEASIAAFIGDSPSILSRKSTGGTMVPARASRLRGLARAFMMSKGVIGQAVRVRSILEKTTYSSPQANQQGSGRKNGATFHAL